MTDPIFYVNGKYLPASQSTLPLTDLGLVRGYGVFDFLRTYNRRPFHLMDHLERLRYSAVQIALELPLPLEEIAEIVHETLARNPLPEANIRLIVTGGPSSNYFTPDQPAGLIVMVTPVSVNPDHVYTAGVHLVTTPLTREFPTVKSLNYIGAILAMKKATAAGAIEALYLNPQGEISEGTRTNFFGVKDGRLITAGEGVLEGITRKVILNLARGHFPIIEQPVTYKELSQVDEAFITSSTKEVMPVVRIDDITIGRGTAGPVSRRLQTMFRAYAYGGGEG